MVIRRLPVAAAVGAVCVILGAGPASAAPVSAAFGAGAPVSGAPAAGFGGQLTGAGDRKSTRLNSSHRCISYAVFCLKKKTAHSSAHPISTTEYALGVRIREISDCCHSDHAYDRL